MIGRPVIAEHLAHIWLASSSDTKPAAWELLDESERQRAAHFRTRSHADTYVLAHALVRVALSACEPAVPPTRWRFETGPHGRPEIAAPRLVGPLRFNLSHTDGLVGCVVTLAADCGLDLERRR